MKSLFLGAKGYLGQNMVAALRQNGEDVVIPLTPDGKRVDITDQESLKIIDWRVDNVYVFAGVSGTGASFDNYEKFLRGNNLGLLNVLNSIRRSSTRPRVVFPSSRLIYRGSDSEITENAMQESKTLYAANKIACENYLYAYANTFDIPYTILRIGVPYGNMVGQQYSFGTVGNFITQAKNTGYIQLYGGGIGMRTFTHVRDICRVIILTVGTPSTLNRTYNMPGECLSLYDAASLIAARFRAKVVNVAWPSFDERIESGSTILDGKKILDTLETTIEYKIADWAKDIPIAPSNVL